MTMLGQERLTSAAAGCYGCRAMLPGVESNDAMWRGL